MTSAEVPYQTHGPNGLDQVLKPTIPSLDLVPDLSEDDLLALTRKIRLRQLAVDLNANEGQLSDDMEVRKVQLALLKDLDSQATKIKLIGAKERASAADREAAIAVQRMLQIMGQHGSVPADPNREAPSITDATELPALELVPEETRVGLVEVTYEELMAKVDNT